jgi:translation elongation factor EF-Tu-like GTPase
MPWPFGRKKNEMDVDNLLAQANVASPTSTTPTSTTPAPAADAPAAAVVAGSFRLPVEDVFSIRGRGTVVTGRVESGTLRVGETVRQSRPDGSTRDVTVTGIEMFRKVTDTANTGDNVGLLLADLGREDIGAGDVLTR